MHDLAFIVAGWGVILGGLGAYAALLLRRLGIARAASLRIRQQSDSVVPPDTRA